MSRLIGYGHNLTHILEIMEQLQPCTTAQVYELSERPLGEVMVYLGRAVRYGLADLVDKNYTITKEGRELIPAKLAQAGSVFEWKRS